MSVNNQFAEVMVAFQKAFSDPDEVFWVLLCKWDTGAQSSMHKQKLLCLVP
jgi:hypothetical protein